MKHIFKRNNKLVISCMALLTMILYYFVAVYIKTPDLVPGFLLTVTPPVVGCVALLILSNKSDDSIPTAATMLVAFLLITGNALQTVLEVNTTTKIFLLNLIALFFSTGALLLYALVIKKKVLINKQGYRKAIFIVFGAIMFLFLIMLVFGSNIGGAKLWLRIGSMTIELSEIIKYLFICLLALVYSSNMEVKQKILYSMIAFGFSFIFFLILNEFGTIIIMFLVYLLSFIIHIRSRFSILFVAGFIVLMVVALVIVYGTHDHIKGSEGFVAEKLNKIYDRLTLSNSDQSIRSIQGMMNGGYFGASMDYLIYVYSCESDFALSSLAQYFGVVTMIMCVVAIGSLLFLVYVRGHDDDYNNRSHYKISFIFMIAIAVQGLLSLAGNIGLPIAGVGCPFISSGGSQSLILYTEVAFVIYGMQTNTSKTMKTLSVHYKNHRRDFYDECEL